LSSKKALRRSSKRDSKSVKKSEDKRL